MLEIIGVGFGRTGTLSLKHAIEYLGHGRCYHFSELLKRAHAKRWLNAIGRSEYDWDNLFAGCRSTTDWPAAAYYAELLHSHPNAKFILTYRDSNEWYESTASTIYTLRRALPEKLPGFRDIAKLTDAVVWQGIFNDRFDDRAHAIDCYEKHLVNVRKTIPAHQLLEFDVSEGWAPLCTFLEKPIPTNTDFPRINDRAQMQRYIKAINLLKLLLFGVIPAGILALLLSVFI